MNDGAKGVRLISGLIGLIGTILLCSIAYAVKADLLTSDWLVIALVIWCIGALFTAVAAVSKLREFFRTDR